jgi:hypothetical protein
VCDLNYSVFKTGLLHCPFRDGLQKLNVKATDGHGFTALHYACMYNRHTLVRAIIASDPTCVTSATPEGLTPLDMARCMGNWEMAYELIGEHAAVRGNGFMDPEVRMCKCACVYRKCG